MFVSSRSMTTTFGDQRVVECGRETERETRSSARVRAVLGEAGGTIPKRGPLGRNVSTIKLYFFFPTRDPLQLLTCHFTALRLWSRRGLNPGPYQVHPEDRCK
ncbi:hypothetical protein O181_058842 [Austropuccinia psidii MF-1]|uniref:Uncharacterized protein n=1 Tax=Austropuccinia psidii MF-1 TaxID=1389203 RepID=A0A9Q3EFJ1_9BASI|nr:hypothetical protein [Austropuccinia psidii MF-1]